MPYKLQKLSEATPTVAGLMSSADKLKLDGLRASYYPERVPDFGYIVYGSYDSPVGKPSELVDTEGIDMIREGVTPAVLRQCMEKRLRLRCGTDILIDMFGGELEEEYAAMLKELLTFDLDVQGVKENEDGSTEFMCISDSKALVSADEVGVYPQVCVGILFDAEGTMMRITGARVYPMLTEEQFAACTNTVGSTNGLCLALPSTDRAKKFLRADGTWAAVPLPDEATTQAAGLMSAADKEKLDKLEEGGGTEYEVFGVGKDGLVPAPVAVAETFLRSDGRWAVPAGGTAVYGMAASRAASRVTIYLTDSDGNVLRGAGGSALSVSIPVADGAGAGFMSKADKEKLDQLEEGGGTEDIVQLGVITMNFDGTETGEVFCPVKPGVVRFGCEDRTGIVTSGERRAWKVAAVPGGTEYMVCAVELLSFDPGYDTGVKFLREEFMRYGTIASDGSVTWEDKWHTMKYNNQSN